LIRSFTLGLTTGIVYFTGTLYWITRVMTVYGGLDEITSVLVNAALIAYLALYPAVFALVMTRLTTAGGRRALAAAPLAWVATELGRTYLFTGFPWVLLGYSQVTVLPVAQLASLLGVYGVSALVVAVNAGLAQVGVAAERRDAVAGKRLNPYASLTVTLIVVCVVVAWGAVRVARSELTRDGEAVRVGLLQGNVNQDDKWNPARAPGIFEDYLQKTREAVGRGAQVVLWPESATPYPFNNDLSATDRIRTLARETRRPIVIGSDQIDPGGKYFNSAFLIGPDGSDGGVYQKMHLVPFGEYVPLRRVFFFASRLVASVSDFSAGSVAVLLPVRGHLVSTAICYEIVYPDLVRQFVRGGSELLTTITNDAWFGPSSAPYQHFGQASMRAIENGRYLVRAANTGISGIVDPYGRVIQASGIFEAAVVVGEARFLRSTTFYGRTGDLFAYFCTALTAALLIGVRRRSYTIK
jgi:apolipoprotein N-acyltransferase